MAASTRSVHDYCPGPYRRLELPANDKYAALHQGLRLPKSETSVVFQGSQSLAL